MADGDTEKPINIYLVNGKVFVGVLDAKGDRENVTFELGDTWVKIPRSSILYIEGSV